MPSRAQWFVIAVTALGIALLWLWTFFGYLTVPLRFKVPTTIVLSAILIAHCAHTYRILRPTRGRAE